MTKRTAMTAATVAAAKAATEPDPIATTEPAPVVAKPVAVAPISEPELSPSEADQIRRFEGNGIAYCKVCIRTLQTGAGDQPICPINKPGCDRNKGG
jgi:hypothetical protein